jgi:hypothetical protein
MSIEFPIYIFFYFFTFYSVIGHGWFFSKIINKEHDTSKKDLGYIGIYGLFFIILYSYVTHHFIPHKEIHNLIFISLGFLFYIYFLISSYKRNLRNHCLLLLIISLVFISSLLAKNHDDFPYYHFPYTIFLTQHSSAFGTGVFNHGFRTPSSIFYIGSIFYLPIIKYYTFHFTAVFILAIANFIFIKKIIDFYNKNSLNFIFYLCLLCFLFINIIFARVAEHGTDISAQILVLILIVELLCILNLKNYYINNYSKIFILSGLIITFKAFFILYSIFVVYLFIFLRKKINFLHLILKNLNFYAFCILVFFSLFAIFQNSGCFLYPIKFTCIGEARWAINKEEISLMSNWYELWSKGGAAPNFRVENPDQYIQGFNWVSNWIRIYFFTKVSDTLLGISFISIITFSIFYNKIKKYEKPSRKYLAILVMIILLFLEWFLKHPALRYGGYCLLALIFFIPTSLLIEKYQQDKIIYKIIFIFVVTIFIFYGRNLSRINKEVVKYQYNPLQKPYYIVNDDFYNISQNIDKLILNFKNCQQLNLNCEINSSPNVSFFYNKYVFFR